jgi:hypothetical protein
MYIHRLENEETRDKNENEKEHMHKQTEEKKS